MSVSRSSSQHALAPPALLAGYRRLSELSFPRSFPILQFPNPPLIVALLAGWAASFAHGSLHAYTTSVAYLALAIWAYEELAHGVNWFRRLLGLAFAVVTVVRVAHAVHS
jgi:hypothetical protein